MPRAYCRVLFVDFSSAFNTIQPHILINKLVDLKMNHYVISWILEFLTNRTQYVKFDNHVSDCKVTNTGAPQGCVISPVLFTLYTNDCSINTHNTKLIKFADDSTIQGLIKNSNEQSYFDFVQYFCNWCDEHYLLLNVKKTKEVIFDFRRNKVPIVPITIKGDVVEIVDSYKYLGITIDNKLDWDLHASNVHSKMSQRLFCLRKLNYFHIDKTLLFLFYSSVIESLLMFCFCGWGGNCKVVNMNSFYSLMKKCYKVCGAEVYQPDFLLEKTTVHKIKRIIKDSTHPLFAKITFSTRKSGRFVSIKTRTERHRKSFLPRAIRAITL